MDQPLTVTRYDYRVQPVSGGSTLTWPRFTWQIYWNYQGLPAYGTLTTGAYAFPYQLGPGQTSCPIIGNQTTQRCVIVQWPFMHSATDQNRGLVPYLSWHGSLLEGKRDRSGLEYRRNRQYDPQSGRFTQEDPIGLAGGLNLYGFAAGDPVTFSDPFGLQACPDSLKNKNECQEEPQQVPGQADYTPLAQCPSLNRNFVRQLGSEFANARAQRRERGGYYGPPWTSPLRVTAVGGPDYINIPLQPGASGYWHTHHNPPSTHYQGPSVEDSLWVVNVARSTEIVRSADSLFILHPSGRIEGCAP